MPIRINQNAFHSGRGFRTYTITIDGFSMQALVTSKSDIASDWIRKTESIHDRNIDKIIVGLDVEWRPSFSSKLRNPVAIIQLCVNNRCLIYQILQSDRCCNDLKRFLQDYKFTGVGIREDASKLMRDYDLEVSNMVDLRDVVADWTGIERLRKTAGLKAMAKNILGIQLEKPQKITLSDWDAVTLNLEQVMYAALDAYVSYKVGTVLKAYRYCNLIPFHMTGFAVVMSS